MKKKLVVNHKGMQFTRTTERTYSHIVICRHNEQMEREQAVARVVSDVNRNWNYYVSEAGDNPQCSTHNEREVELYKHIVAIGKEKYIKELTTESVALIDEYKKRGRYSTIFAHAWCGRHDLAAKQAMDALRSGYINVEIVEVCPAEN